MALFCGFRFQAHKVDHSVPSGYQLIAPRYDSYWYLGKMLHYPFLPTSIREVMTKAQDCVQRMMGDTNVRAFITAQGIHEQPDLYLVPRDFNEQQVDSMKL